MHTLQSPQILPGEKGVLLMRMPGVYCRTVSLASTSDGLPPQRHILFSGFQ